MSPVSREPMTLVDRAAEAAIDAVIDTLELGGAVPDKIVVLVSAKDVPDGEEGRTTSAAGMKDHVDVIATLTEHLIEAGKEMGFTIMLAPIQKSGMLS